MVYMTSQTIHNKIRYFQARGSNFYYLVQTKPKKLASATTSTGSPKFIWTAARGDFGHSEYSLSCVFAIQWMHRCNSASCCRQGPAARDVCVRVCACVRAPACLRACAIVCLRARFRDCASACACVRACVRACARACVRACA